MPVVRDRILRVDLWESGKEDLVVDQNRSQTDNFWWHASGLVQGPKFPIGLTLLDERCGAESVRIWVRAHLGKSSPKIQGTLQVRPTQMGGMFESRFNALAWPATSPEIG